MHALPNSKNLLLHLGFFDQNLAYRFGINQSTISRNFRKWIDAEFTKSKPLIKWPGHEDFKAHFKNVLLLLAF